MAVSNLSFAKRTAQVWPAEGLGCRLSRQACRRLVLGGRADRHIVGSGAAEHQEFVKSWKQQGKRWIVECGVPALDGTQPLTPDEAFAYWTQNVGFTDPLLRSTDHSL